MTVLLVDDDLDELVLFNEAIQEVDSRITFVTTTDGDLCLEMLKNVTPDIIFLDINMPRMNGKDCLKALRKNEDLKNVPVIMYSTTINPSDEEFFTAFNIPFKKKPTEFNDLVDFVKTTVVGAA